MEMEHQTRAENGAASKDEASHAVIIKQVKIFTSKDYKWWCRIFLYITSLLCGQSSVTLLGRLYFQQGGNSKWMSTFITTAGFPLFIPILFCFRRITKSAMVDSSSAPLSIRSCALLYLFLGLLLTVDNRMYTYGLAYLPVSTYSLLCATQLAFNAVFSFLLNSQKFTALIINSLVLLTVSASLLVVQADTDKVTKASRAKYAIGFLCTLGASAIGGLYLSLLELFLKRLFKRQTITIFWGVIIFPGFVASSAAMVGLFASGEWKTLQTEAKQYHGGRVSYVMTLLGIGISSVISALGSTGLIVEMSSLFANVISTLALPAVPVLAVLTFHDKMNGVKVIALVLSLWGFVSYIYQHYLDDIKSKSATANGDEVSASV